MALLYGREPNAAGVGSVLYLPEGRALRAERGVVWLYEGIVYFRRKGEKRPLLQGADLREIEEVQGDWLNLRHYRLRTSVGLVDLVPIGGDPALRELVARLALESGLAIRPREVESLVVGHLQGLWGHGPRGRLLVGAELVALAALLAYAYASG